MTAPTLTDRVVLLTGATGDIGAAYTFAFTAAGAHVIAADLPQLAQEGKRLAEKATAQGPGTAVFAGCDITSDVDVTGAVALAGERFGGLDAVVNNAASYRTLGPKRPLTELTADDWDTVLRVNVRGTWQTIKTAVPALRVGRRADRQHRVSGDEDRRRRLRPLRRVQGGRRGTDPRGGA
jgi:NAD(P)-dependent dehydrogenase (short-subunit alcohol dehydrogenase family)